jgi:hypothetical protein
MLEYVPSLKKPGAWRWRERDDEAIMSLPCCSSTLLSTSSFLCFIHSGLRL